eukprot:UN22137
MILHALRELEMDSPKSSENEESGRLITPQEACNRIAEVVQEAVRKMELVAEEKMGLYKRLAPLWRPVTVSLMRRPDKFRSSRPRGCGRSSRWRSSRALFG